MDRTRHISHHRCGFPPSADSGRRLSALEKGTYRKKWTGRLPIALVYPNTYRVGMSSLGFQLVYHLLNEHDHVVCERFFLSDIAEKFVSFESNRPLDNFPFVFFSVSFELDYCNIASCFLRGGLEPFAQRRDEAIEAGNPLVVCGGVAVFMNPEPLAPFVDVCAVGEAEMLIPPLLTEVIGDDRRSRERLLHNLVCRHDGFYAPRFHEPLYDEQLRFQGFQTVAGVSERVKKVVLPVTERAAHSQLLTPETEFADLYLTELGRGCSRGCRFCAAGFVYRPPRLWAQAAIERSLEQCPPGIVRVGLLGMEMSEPDTVEAIAAQIDRNGCSLSFSSLRADRISRTLAELLARSSLKSVAIAPDGASERLRRVINKGLSRDDLLSAAQTLTEAGLHRLKLYLMIGLPTETDDDLWEFVRLVEQIRELMDKIGRARGRLCELVISAHCFVPKPWTPFQYHPFGVSESIPVETAVAGKSACRRLRDKINLLKKGLGGLANTRVRHDSPEQALFQAVLSRGDRRLAEVLLNMADSGISWRQAMKQQGLDESLFATRQYGPSTCFPWRIIDHCINDTYLWREYRKATAAEMSPPCDTSVCRRCGVCHD